MSALAHPSISSPVAMPVGDHAVLRLLERRPSARRADAAPDAPQTRAGLLERLGQWADRQPVHHRLGSWYPLT